MELESGNRYAVKQPGSKRGKNLQACVGGASGTLAVLCLILGLIAIITPFTSSSTAVAPVDPGATQTCQSVTPATSPLQPSSTVAATAAAPYLTKWEAYVADISSRPEGIMPGCEPLRFASTASAYKGVVVVWHGFSSCTQEMAILGPPLAAHGFDVLMPVLPGHGNALEYGPDGGFWLWGYLTLGISLLFLACLCCCRGCPCCSNRDCLGNACGTTDRGRTLSIYGCAVICLVLLIVSVIAIILVAVGPGVAQCISLSPTATSCFGKAEENDNLPFDAAKYTAGIDRINDIAALATGVRVVVGLSGGGAAAAYAGQAAVPGGTSALYTRQLLIAPYIGLKTFQSILGPAASLGLGRIKIHYGESCAIERRAAGKAGYCNIELRHILAMRDVGERTLAGLATPPGATIQVVGVVGDAVVMNTKTDELYKKYTAEAGTSASQCLFGGDISAYHSPLSIWNYPDQDMHWIGDLVCRHVGFIVNGNFMLTGTASSEGPPLCATPCDDKATKGSCGWNCTKDSFLGCGA